MFYDQLDQWVSDAEVAEIEYTAFKPTPKAKQVTARLIVRSVRNQNPRHVQRNTQGELFRVWRHHAVFTDSPLPTLEADHRRHAIIEHVHADLKHSPLAQLPSGHFGANSAWLVLASMVFNPTRAAGALASAFHAKATTATTRHNLINVAARVTAPPADQPCYYPQPGAGPTSGRHCSPQHPGHQPEPEPSTADRPNPRTQKRRTDRRLSHALATSNHNEGQLLTPTGSAVHPGLVDVQALTRQLAESIMILTILESFDSNKSGRIVLRCHPCCAA